MPDRYAFPGHLPFLQAAEAGATGRAVSHARRQPAVSAIASLAAQACDAPDAHRADIFSQAVEVRAGLAIALDAADAILAEVAERLGLEPPLPPAESAGYFALRDEVADLTDKLAKAEVRADEADALIARVSILEGQLAEASARAAEAEAHVEALTAPAPADAPPTP